MSSVSPVSSNDGRKADCMHVSKPWSRSNPFQTVVCGHGTRYRNLSCFVSDGSGDDEGSQVDEELCGGLELAVEGDKQIRLKEACTLPCPGKNPPSWSSLTSWQWQQQKLKGPWHNVQQYCKILTLCWLFSITLHAATSPTLVTTSLSAPHRC